MKFQRYFRVALLAVICILASFVAYGQDASPGNADLNQSAQTTDVPLGGAISADDAQARHNANLLTAKQKYLLAVAEAHADFFKSLIGADEQYIGQLDGAIKSAMQAGETKVVERTDAKREQAVADRMSHYRSWTRTPALIIVHVVAGDPRQVDVTSKVKDIITKGGPGTVLPFGVISSLGGRSLDMKVKDAAGKIQTITVWTEEKLPDDLFPPTDDPKAIIP